MANFFANQFASWTFNRKVNNVKKGVNDAFGSSDNNITLDSEPEQHYDKDEHASSSAKRASAAHAASKESIKSNAVKAAMERRADAKLAAARKAAGKR